MMTSNKCPKKKNGSPNECPNLNSYTGEGQRGQQDSKLMHKIDFIALF